MKIKGMVKKSALCLFAAGIFISCRSAQKTSHDFPPPANPLVWAVEIYQGPLDHLSAVRWGECPMHPSCSEYSRQALKKYGPIRGWIMTTDRLIRCGRDEIRRAPRIIVGGKWKYYDPLHENDSVWRKQVAGKR